MYSSKRFTIKRCDIASLKLIRNVKCAINKRKDKKLGLQLYPKWVIL